MDQQNTSSHPLIPPNFASAAAGFPSHIAGLNSNGNNVSNNPMFLSTLQQLSFSNAASSLLQPTQLSINNQLTADLTNVPWNNQSNTWLDSAKMAAMLPMYTTMLQSSVNDSAQSQFDFVEQSIKAAAAARAPGSISSAAINLATQQAAGVNVFANPTMPIMALAAAAGNQSLFPSVSQTNNIHSSASNDLARSANHNSVFSSATNSLHQNSSINSISALAGHNDGIRGTDPSALFLPSSLGISKSTASTKNAVMPDFSMSLFSVPQSTQSTPLAPVSPKNLQPHPTTTANSGPSGHRSLSPHLNTFLSLPSTSGTKDLGDDLAMIDLRELELFHPKDASAAVTSSALFASVGSAALAVPSTSGIQDSLLTAVSESLTASTKTKNHQRELDTDKELDQWLSMAVGGGLDESPHGSPLSNFGENCEMDLFPAEATGISLEPMFTPPDSPTHSDAHKRAEPKQPSSVSHHSLPPSATAPPPRKQFKPTPELFSPAKNPIPEPEPEPSLSSKPLESLFFLPKPKTVANDRVPVYKRKATNNAKLSLEKALDKVTKSKTADEYSFTDDEEEEKPKTSLFGPEEDEESNQGAPPDGALPSTSDCRGTEPQAKKKMGEEHGHAPEETSEEKPAATSNNLAKIIQSRREVISSLPTAFIYSVPLDPDDDDTVVILPEAPGTKEEEKETPGAALERVPSVPSSPQPNVVSEPVNGNQKLPVLDLTVKPAPPEPVECVKEESPEPMDIDVVTVDEPELPPPPPPIEPLKIIPKLVIKLNRRESDISPPLVHKKKKKHKKKHHDDDWEPSDVKKKKKKHKHKHKHRHHEVKVESTPIVESVPSVVVPSVAKTKPLTDEELVLQRLACFGIANGDSPKGTFVIAKQDIMKPDCPLWKVDNQNLLQKYPQINDKNDNLLRYKNSSTYSGWCDQVAAGYFVVQVRYLKQTRAETIVEPQVPLRDLFPAVSEIVASSETWGLPEESSLDDIFEPVQASSSAAKDPIRNHMRTFMHAMLRHATTLAFLQTIKNCNDWDYLCALNEVENMTSLGKQRINDRVRWGQRFEVMLTIYANMILCEQLAEDVPCQACGDKVAVKNLQLFSNESYNYDSLEIDRLPDIDGESPQVAIEFSLCARCAHLSITYHKLHHMRYTILKHCEDMLMQVSTCRPELSVDAVITLCMNKRSVQRKLISEYAALWRRVQQNDL